MVFVYETTGRRKLLSRQEVGVRLNVAISPNLPTCKRDYLLVFSGFSDDVMVEPSFKLHCLGDAQRITWPHVAGATTYTTPPLSCLIFAIVPSLKLYL